jgi:class 3 adenylate cyclase/tetratricopeptide (TPR) repeat protein
MTSGARLRGSQADRRIVTVLFADISGFTHLGESLDPEELTDFLHECVGSLVQEVVAHDGWVEKQIGDAVLGVFGAPTAHDDDPVRAVHTALGMHKRMRSLGGRLVTRLGHEPSLHIGINTGLVVMGPGIEAGEDGTSSLIVVGDTVNLGARLQQAAGPGQVLVGESTFAATRHVFEYRQLPSLSVKGKRQRVVAYECLGLRPRGEPSERRSAFIGRGDEVATLSSCIDRLVAGRGQVVAVTGEAGIGKSRLVREARNRSEERIRFWLEGRAHSFGETLSYWPFREVLRAWAGITEQDADGAGWAKLEKGLRRLFDHDFGHLLPYVAILLGLDVPDSHSERVKYLTGEAAGRQIFRVSRRLFERIPEEGALVLALEDLHWADESTISLVEHLLPLTRNTRVLILLTWRSEVDGSVRRLRELLTMEFSERFTEIQLAPLSRESAAELIQSWFPFDDIPRRERSLVLERAQGNPFFLEELGRVLADSSPLGDAGLPDSLRGVIVARLDKLPQDLKDILRVAAVIGRDFSYGLLRAVTRESEEKLRRKLLELVQRGLVEEHAWDTGEHYIFSHPLVQETVYESILLGRRRDLHGRIGQALETSDRARPEPPYALLAYHYGRAEEWERAHECLIRAGDQAAQIAADSESLYHYRHAISAHARVFGERWEPLQQARLERKMGEALLRRGAHQEAIEYLHRALAHLGRPFPRRVRLGIAGEVARRLVRRIVSPRRFPGEHRTSEEEERSYAYERAAWIDYFLDQERFVLDILLLLNASERAGRDEGTAGASAALAIVLDLLNMDRLARRYRTHALDLAQRMGHPVAIGSAYLSHALHGFNRGDWATSIEYFERAAVAFQKVGDFRGWGAAMSVTPWLLGFQGRLAESLQRSRELVEVADEAGDAQLRAWGLLGIGKSLSQMGDLDEALEPLLEATQLFKEIPDPLSVSDAMSELGLQQLRAGDVEEAIGTLDRGVRMVVEGRVKGFLTTQAYAGLAEAYVSLVERADGRERRRAVAQAKDALKRATRLSKVVLPGIESGYRTRGTLEWILGRAMAAKRWWRRSLALSQEIGSRWELGRTELEVGKRLRDSGHLARAERIFSEIGAKPHVQEARQLLAVHAGHEMP